MVAAAMNGKGGTAKVTPSAFIFQSVILESEEAGAELQVGQFRIGSFHDQPGADAILAVLKVARILLSRQCRFRLIIMLKEGMVAEVNSWLQEESDSQQLKQVIELMAVTEESRHFKKLDVCLWWGTAGEHPLSILKGMAEGVPWIAVGQTDVVELLFGKEGDKNGPAGFVVPKDAADMVADYCEWFMKHPEMRQQFAESGRRRAMELCGI